MSHFTFLLSYNFMPHGTCYLWESHILWLHVVADSLIAASYYCIPIILIYFIRKHRGLPFNRIFWMFGSFILACGTTHLLEVWNVWHADYLVAGIMKAVTAAISLLTTAMLIRLVPKFIALPERAHLQELNRDLERRLEERENFNDPIDTSAQRKIAVGLVLALVLTAISGVSAWHSAARAAEDAFWVAHTYEVMEVIQRTTRHTMQVETTARAFALSGEERLLIHYEEACQKVLHDEQQLRRLTVDNRSQQQRLDILEVQSRSAIDFGNRIIVKRKNG
jgi:CHASE3 domain